MSTLDPQRTVFKHRSPSRPPSQHIHLFCRSQSESELSLVNLPGPDAPTVRYWVPADALSQGEAQARRRSRGAGGDGVRLLGVWATGPAWSTELDRQPVALLDMTQHCRVYWEASAFQAQ